MAVRVHQAREHELPGDVDHLGVARVHATAQLVDRAVADQYVRGAVQTPGPSATKQQVSHRHHFPSMLEPVLKLGVPRSARARHRAVQHDLAMKIYAELAPRRLRQLLADVLVIAWIGAGIWFADWLRDRAASLAEAGRKLEQTGTDLSDKFADAGDQARRAPGVGRIIARPFETGTDAADALVRAGQTYQDAIEGVGAVMASVVLVITFFVVLVGWLPPRARWVRRASVAARLRAEPAGRDLLALRALTSQPLRRLRNISDNPAGDWRAGDPATLTALAALELRSAGLRQQ
jgi:hypothetical protein